MRYPIASTMLAALLRAYEQIPPEIGRIAYFRTMQIPLIAGRALRPDDPASFAVINQTMATHLWPGENPIDKQFTDGDNPPVKVIGVVGDVHNASLEKPAMMQFYRLVTADPYYADTFVVRSAYDPEGLIPRVQQAVWQLDASEPVTHAQAMERLLDAVTLQRRFETALFESASRRPRCSFPGWDCLVWHRSRQRAERGSLVFDWRWVQPAARSCD